MKIDDEQALGLILKTVLDEAREEMLAEVMRTAMRGAPLPAPWSMWCDKQGELFFTNENTGEQIRHHPLTDLLQELADVGRKSLALPMDVRVERLSTLSTTWEAEAREEMLDWRRARDEKGGQYFFHRKNRKVMWESPAESLLPVFFLKTQLIETLSDSKYQAGIDNQSQTQTTPLEQSHPESPGANSKLNSTQKTRPNVQMNEDRALGLILQSLLKIPGDEMLLEVLQTAMKGAPLPAPWSMWCDKQGQLFFSNGSTGERTRTHPLTALLKELADIGRECLSVPMDTRLERLSSLRGSWEEDARQEIGKWHPAKDEKGREYYFHRENRRVMWETPADALLPVLFLKTQFIETLRDRRYQEGIWEPQLPQTQLTETQSNSMDANDYCLAGTDLPVVQTEEDRALGAFLISFLKFPGDEILLDVLQTATNCAPLPPPWKVSCDEKGYSFFWNPATDEVTREHPHAALLKELADVGQKSLAMPTDTRAEHLASLEASWEMETRKELVKWKSAMESGRQYFYHQETKQVMWERPIDALLPAFFLKRQVLEALGDCKYQTVINSDELPPPRPSAVSEAIPPPPPSAAASPGLDADNEEGPVLPTRDIGGTQSPRGYPSFELSPETPQQEPHVESLQEAQLQEISAASSYEAPQPHAESPTETQLQEPLAAPSPPEALQQEPHAESSPETQLQVPPAAASLEGPQQEPGAESLLEASLQEPPAEMPPEAPQQEASSPEALLLESPAMPPPEATPQEPCEQSAISGTQTPREPLLDFLEETEVPPAPLHEPETSSMQETALAPTQLDEDQALCVVLKRLKLSDDELLLKMLHAASKGAPLPAPWSMWRDKRGHLFFSNSTTGEITREHPHSALLVELAEIGQRSIMLNLAAREEQVAALQCSWEASGRAEAQSWQPARDAQGLTYYFNVKTSEVMWENPAEVFMPGLFLRKLFLEQLAAAPATEGSGTLRAPGPPPTPPLPRAAGAAEDQRWKQQPAREEKALETSSIAEQPSLEPGAGNQTAAAAAAAADYGAANFNWAAAAAAADYGSLWPKPTAATDDHHASVENFMPPLPAGPQWSPPAKPSMMLSRRWSNTRSEAFRLSKARAAPSEQAPAHELRAALGEAKRRLTIFDEDHQQQRQRLLRRRRGGAAKAPPAALAEAKERLTGFDRELQGLMSGEDQGHPSDDSKQEAPASPKLEEARSCLLAASRDVEEQKEVELDQQPVLEFFDLSSLGLR